MTNPRAPGRFLLVLTTVPEEKKSLSIARTLVREKLAACVTICPTGRSVFRWQGKTCLEKERVLLIKTKSSLFDRLQSRIKEIHPYTVPEIIALPILKGSTEYLGWLDREASGD